MNGAEAAPHEQRRPNPLSGVDVQAPGTDPVTARRKATLVIATIRGLLLDLLATGDRDRVQDAAEAFLATL